jgi:thiamine-monophosphate kinase
MDKNPDRLGEFELIDRYFARRNEARDAAAGVILGIGDDAALLRVPDDRDLVAAVDTIVAGRHFLESADPRAIGHRALAVNLSDLAAMGATPAWATLALTIPHADRQWLAAFSAGLAALAERHGVVLVGGDTTAGPLTVSIQLLGVVPRGTALRRSGAASGDLLVVTGTLGDAGAGLWLARSAAGMATGVDDPPSAALAELEPDAVTELVRRYQYPTPRVAFGLAARGLATAAMDLSDGLVADLPKLAAASGLAAEIDVGQLPLSASLRTVTTPAQATVWALGAGDDYELLLAVPAERFAELARAGADLDLCVTQIGHLREGRGVIWTAAGRAFAPSVAGYDHFR